MFLVQFHRLDNMLSSFFSIAAPTNIFIKPPRSTPTLPTVVADPFRQFITNGTSISNWNAAPSGSWVRVTRQEYGLVTASVTGGVVVGHSNELINTRLVQTGTARASVYSSGTVHNPLITLESGQYVVAYVVESWNQNGTVNMGYVDQFVTGSPQWVAVSSSVIGGARSYLVRKAAPSYSDQLTPVTTSLYPVIEYNFPTYPNSVSGGLGWNYSSSFSSPTRWVQNLASQTGKLQMLVTTTNPWATA